MLRYSPLAGLLFVVGTAHASDKPIYAPAPDWVKPAPLPTITAGRGEEGGMLLFDQQQRIQDGQLWAYVDTAVNIVTPEILAQVGTLQAQWQPEDGDLIVHKVSILRAGEEIDLLKGDNRFTVLRRESQLEALQMNGVLTATMAAEGLRVGDIMRLSYSVTRTDRVLKGSVQTLMPLLAAPLRVGFARARLLWKRDAAIVTKTYLPAIVAKPKLVDGYYELDVPLPLAKPADLPDDIPVRFRPLPILEASSFADWAAVSSVMAPLYRTEGLIAPDSALAAEVDRIAKAESDPRKRAAAALQLVQGQVRYLYRGFDGGNYRPQAPTLTWTARYGDCKAKTLLLLALLHGLGIEADAVMANIQLGDAVPTRLPSASAFDHVLVRATVAGQTLWLDGTGLGARLIDLDDAPPFGWVLPVQDKGAELVKVERRPAGRPDIAIVLELDQSAGLGLPALYDVKITMRGQLAGQLTSMAAQITTEQRKEMLQGTVAQAIGDSMVVTSALSDDSLNGTAVVTASGIISSGWQYEDKRYHRVVDRAVSSLSFQPDRTRPAWRDLPVAIGSVGSFAMSTRLTLPQGGKGFTLDGDATLPATLAGVRLQRSASLNGAIVRVDDRADPVGGEIAPKDIATTRSALALANTRLLRVRAPSDYPLRWQIVLAARREGRLKPIEAAYNRAIATEPKAAVAYQNRANFLVGVYDRRGAIADLGKVIEIEPTIYAYLQRANLYRALNENDKALADATAAFDLDPSAIEAIGLLTSLQAVTGKLDEALATLDAHIDAGGKDKVTYLQLKSDVLSRAGRGTEAVATMDLAVAENPGSSTLLNGRCWAKATNRLALDTALKDCTRAIELGGLPAATFDSRALAYLQLGRLDEALADADAALDISPGLPTSLFVRGVIRKRKGDNAGADADLAAARMMSPQVDADYARWGIKP